jgi:hypothetical protein
LGQSLALGHGIHRLEVELTVVSVKVPRRKPVDCRLLCVLGKLLKRLR